MIIKTLIDNDFWLMTRIKGNTKTGLGTTGISIVPKEGLDLETVRNIGCRACPDTCPHKKAFGKRKTGTCYTYKVILPLLTANPPNEKDVWAFFSRYFISRLAKT